MGKYNGFDALKFGFFGQIGRNLGRDFYNSAANSLSNIDTSSVDQSKIGATDANGNFSYQNYKRTSVVEYIFWLIFIGIMPHLFTLIIFFKTIIRIFRRKVRFVVYYECPVYKSDRRTRTGRAYLGRQSVPFEFRKSFEEAEKGICEGEKQYNPVLGTKINTLLYVVLTIIGMCWSYFIIAKVISVNEAEKQNRIAAVEQMTQWNDSIIVDDFTQSSTTIRYLFPETKDNTLSDMLILVRMNDKLYFYTSTLSYRKAEIKFSNSEDVITIEKFEPEIMDVDSDFVVKPLGYNEMKFGYRYEIENIIASKIESGDNFAIRLDGDIFKFNCK